MLMWCDAVKDSEMENVFGSEAVAVAAAACLSADDNELIDTFDTVTVSHVPKMDSLRHT